MTPGLGSVPYNQVEQTSVPRDLLNLLSEKDIYNQDNRYPVGEFSEVTPKSYNSEWYKSPKPINIPLTAQLLIQGLDRDPFRGAITSSMQRDPVSAVYGISTPGRQLVNQDPALDPTLDEKVRTGNFDPATFEVYVRKGGHSLVLDDGDIKNQNNLVRLRTAAGHQVLMNDSKGFMYISNAAGTAWVELTKEGDILVYGKRDLAIRTQGSIMMRSDKNINFEAGANFNVSAKSKITFESPSISTNASSSLELFGKTTALKSGGALQVVSSGALSLKSNQRMSLNAPSISLNGGGGGAGSASPPPTLSKFNLNDTMFVNGRWEIEPMRISSINNKVPTHEPYLRDGVAVVVEPSATTNVNGDAISANPSQPSNNVGQAKTNTTSWQERKALNSSFINSYDPKVGLGSLNENEFQAYLAQMGYAESGGQYKPVTKISPAPGYNQLGYMGKYQLGLSALQDLGYMKKTYIDDFGVERPLKTQSYAVMSNPNNWISGKGPEEFLNSPEAQESAMIRYTKGNYVTLQNKGIIPPTGAVVSDEDKQNIAGCLAGSHLAGAGRFSKWYTGTLSPSWTDANGTKISTYYNLGRYSQTQVQLIEASKKSKL